MADAEDFTPNNNDRKNSHICEDSSTRKDDILKQLCGDYTEYMKLDIKKESTEFEDSIEEMLTRLDEFCGLVDMIRSDTNLCLGRTLPTIHKKCLEMEKMFDKIDQLEAFVRVVSQDVAVVEKQVEEAESEMGSLSGIKKVFKSFPTLFSSKKSPTEMTPVPRRSRFVPPEIFSTESYLQTPPEGLTGSTTQSSVGGTTSTAPRDGAAGSATQGGENTAGGASSSVTRSGDALGGATGSVIQSSLDTPDGASSSVRSNGDTDVSCVDSGGAQMEVVTQSTGGASVADAQVGATSGIPSQKHTVPSSGQKSGSSDVVLTSGIDSHGASAENAIFAHNNDSVDSVTEALPAPPRDDNSTGANSEAQNETNT